MIKPTSGRLLRVLTWTKSNGGPLTLVLTVIGMLVGVVVWAARLDSSVTEFDDKIDVKFDAQNRVINAKFDAHNKVIAAKFDAHNKVIAAKFEAQIKVIEAKLDAQDDKNQVEFKHLNDKVDNLTEDLRLLRDEIKTMLAARSFEATQPAIGGSEGVELVSNDDDALGTTGLGGPR